MKKGSQRGRGRIFKRPDSPLWWIAYMVDRLDGKGNLSRKEKRESTGSPKHADAIALLDQRVRERKEEKLVENPNVTVRELLEDLVAHYEVRRLASARTSALTSMPSATSPATRPARSSPRGRMASGISGRRSWVPMWMGC